jgi:multiple sugar transport system permease protein
MVVIFGVPLLCSLVLSTVGWRTQPSLSAHEFDYGRTFIHLLTDDRFRSSVMLTVGYTAATVAAEVLLGLGMALLLNMELRFIGLLRTIIVIPMAMTPVVAALTWKLLLDPNAGLIDAIIGRPIVWLGTPMTARLAIAGVNVWQNAPYVALLLLAGLRSLPREPFESALLDGASSWQRFRYVTLPLLRPYILIASLLRTIFEFRAFDYVYVMTSGGPADSTMVLSMFTYLVSFVQSDLSLGAAASWVMLLCVLPVCAALITALRTREVS